MSFPRAGLLISEGHANSFLQPWARISVSSKTMCAVTPPFSPRLYQGLRAESSGPLSLTGEADVLCISLTSHLMSVKHSFTPTSRDSEHVPINIFPDCNVQSF